jgi:hypothetical protein
VGIEIDLVDRDFREVDVDRDDSVGALETFTLAGRANDRIDGQYTEAGAHR